MGGLWKLEGYDWSRVRDMVVHEMPKIIAAEWVLWVPTMALTFKYAPVKYQVLVINVVGVVWQTFLSVVANEAHDHHSSKAADTTVVPSSSTTERLSTTTTEMEKRHGVLQFPQLPIATMTATQLGSSDCSSIHEFFDSQCS